MFVLVWIQVELGVSHAILPIDCYWHFAWPGVRIPHSSRCNAVSLEQAHHHLEYLPFISRFQEQTRCFRTAYGRSQTKEVSLRSTVGSGVGLPP